MKKVPTKKASKHAAPSFFLPLVGIEKAFNEHSPQPKRLGIRRSSAAVPQDTRARYILLSSFFLSLPDIVRTRSLSLPGSLIKAPRSFFPLSPFRVVASPHQHCVYDAIAPFSDGWMSTRVCAHAQRRRTN